MLWWSSKISWQSITPLGNSHHPSLRSLRFNGRLSLIRRSDSALWGMQNKPPFMTCPFSYRASCSGTKPIIPDLCSLRNKFGQSFGSTLWHARQSPGGVPGIGTRSGMDSNSLARLGDRCILGSRIPATSGTEALSGFTGKAPHIASSRFTSGLYCEKRILLINSSSLAEPLYPRSP